jgi:nitrogen fixation/metabolism regulation signal transduction histidine kinase
MNSLSWLIYAANVAQSLSGFLVFITTVFALGAIVACIVALVHMDEQPNYRQLSEPDLTLRRKRKVAAFKLSCALFAVMTITGITTSLIPSRQTVLLIAASEIGERALTHQRVQDVVDPSINLLQTLIQQQTQQIQQQMQPQPAGRVGR